MPAAAFGKNAEFTASAIIKSSRAIIMTFVTFSMPFSRPKPHAPNEITMATIAQNVSVPGFVSISPNTPSTALPSKPTNVPVASINAYFSIQPPTMV